jgi:hypothetical protein
VGVFDRFFGKGRDVRAARRAELRGDLARAVELYGLASAPDEAARVMLMRGDAETDVRARMVHFTQAVATAPSGHPVRDEARRKRAALVVAQLGSGPASQGAKQELRAAGNELLEVGDATAAAEAFKLAGDLEGQASALTAAGDVESLEALLTERQTKERAERERTDVHQDVELLLTSGRRREALTTAERWLATHDDASLRDHVRTLEARRLMGPRIRVAIRAAPMTLLLGEDVVIGRTDGNLLVSSAAVSHRHVRISRDGEAIVARDLETRNGTQLRGMDLRGAVPVPSEGLDLVLGKQVRVRIARSAEVEGAVRVEVAGDSYVSALGKARIPGLPWELLLAKDTWVELVTNGRAAYFGEVSLSERTTLLVGDVVASERGGSEVMRILGRE